MSSRSGIEESLSKCFDRYVCHFYHSLYIDNKDPKLLKVKTFNKELTTIGISEDKSTVMLGNENKAFLVATSEDS